MAENSRVTLPKPLDPTHEAHIEMRREIHLKTFRDHREKFCNSKGEQISNLTERERSGLDSLKKRIKSGELVILETDKSNKFAVTTEEKYLEMGHVHTAKDRKISRDEIREKQKIVNGHMSMWIKMQNAGADWNHSDRFRASKIVHIDI